MLQLKINQLHALASHVTYKFSSTVVNKNADTVQKQPLDLNETAENVEYSELKKQQQC